MRQAAFQDSNLHLYPSYGSRRTPERPGISPSRVNLQHPVLSKYSNCLKSLAEVIGLANDNLGADLERSLPILRSCYFIADSVDLVHILVTEKSDPTKTARNRPNLGIRHPHVQRKSC